MFSTQSNRRSYDNEKWTPLAEQLVEYPVINAERKEDDEVPIYTHIYLLSFLLGQGKCKHTSCLCEAWAKLFRKIMEIKMIKL